MNRQDFCKTRLREKLRQRACEVFYRLIKKLPHRITVATLWLGKKKKETICILFVLADLIQIFNVTRAQCFL